MTKTKIGLALALLLGLAAPEAEALGGNIKYFQSRQNEDCYAEANTFYQLPGRISGFTFVDFHKNNNGYYGRTALEKEISHGLALKSQTIHNNDLAVQSGIGISAKMPMPKGTFATVSFIPLWLDNKGIVKDKATVSYFASMNLPYGLNVNNFGEWNVTDRLEWIYGELQLGKKIGNVTLSYNPALNGKGNAVPKLEHRASISLSF